VGVATIINKMRENGFRWFNHIIRRGDPEELRVPMEIHMKKTREGEIDRITNG